MSRKTGRRLAVDKIAFSTHALNRLQVCGGGEKAATRLIRHLQAEWQRVDRKADHAVFLDLEIGGLKLKAAMGGHGRIRVLVVTPTEAGYWATSPTRA